MFEPTKLRKQNLNSAVNLNNYYLGGINFIFEEVSK